MVVLLARAPIDRVSATLAAVLPTDRIERDVNRKSVHATSHSFLVLQFKDHPWTMIQPFDFMAGHVLDSWAVPLAKALAEGNMEKAQEEIEKLVKKLQENQLSDKERQQLAKQVQNLQERLKQSFIIENRQDASTVLGTTAVAHSAPDGYTLLHTDNAFYQNPAILKNLPYDTLKDFSGVTMLAQAPVILIVQFVLAGGSLAVLGLISAIVAQKFDHIATFTNFFITPLSFLSGVFYSVHSLPPLWHEVSHLNPFFYMIDGFRYGFFGKADVPAWVSLCWATGFFVASSALCLALLHRGYRLRH